MKKMYQTMKEAIVGKLPWIVGAIIVIQPLLDVLSYFLGEMGKQLPLHRPAFFAVDGCGPAGLPCQR